MTFQLRFLRPSLDWLLPFVPAALALHFLAPRQEAWIFICACLAIVPLAGWMGVATENLAERTTDAVGGLLNATFGNAAELIIAIAALRQGRQDLVKASLTGSIIGNILLVNGAAFLAGGMKYKQQYFNGTAARSQSTMLTLAAIALLCPMMFHLLEQQGARGQPLARPHDLSLAIAVVLLIVYALGLLFALKTHKSLFTRQADGAASWERADEPEAADDEPVWSVRKSILVLACSTALVAWLSEFLVSTVESASRALRMTDVFIGVIVVAIIGNAAEHSTALLAARRNRMELALAISQGSSMQIAMFVAPLLLLLSYFIGPHGPMDLVFTPAEAFSIFVSAQIAGQLTSHGESNWLEGAQLLSVYAILGIMFYLLS